MTALIHLTHSICSRAPVNRLTPLPDDRDESPSSKQSSPPRVRNSRSHSLLAGFSRRGRIPEKFFSDGVSNSLTHNSGSASAIIPSLFSREIFLHLEVVGMELWSAMFTFKRCPLVWNPPLTRRTLCFTQFFDGRDTALSRTTSEHSNTSIIQRLRLRPGNGQIPREEFVCSQAVN